MARIFINYRRDDTPGVAGRLFDHLVTKFSRRELFMDVDAMKPGIDFAQQLDSQVSHCHVLLAVIGPRWLDALDRSGKRRLDNEGDYVRIELASALKRDIAVIPVLVDGASMPAEESLTDDLKPLARRHALELRHTRFAADVDAIVHSLEATVPRRRVSLLGAGIGIAVVLAAAAAGVVLRPMLTAKPSPPPSLASSAKPAAATPPSAAPQQAAIQPSAAPAPSTPQAAAPDSSSAGLPQGFKLGEMTSGVSLRGSLFRVTDVPPDPANCQAACRGENHCVAWTYAQPAAPGQPARCSMKAVIPQRVTDACCTSGIERVPSPEMREAPPIPPGVTGAVSGIELEGGTYHYFGGAAATPQACQSACRADGQCLAWDYARPGVYSNEARCFLKNKPSNQFSSPCCIAGFERQVASVAAAVATAAAPGVAPNLAIASAPNAAPAAAASAGLPAGAKLGEIMPGTALPGSVMRELDIEQGDATNCQAACRAESSCAAWTFNPGRTGQFGHCMLKALIPEAHANACCFSGIERTPPQELRVPPVVPADVIGAQQGVDLFGGEYRSYSGPQATPEACQGTCKSEGRCLAWTYVRPGVMGAEARCFLKARPSTLVHSNCCISGVERQPEMGGGFNPAAPGPGREVR